MAQELVLELLLLLGAGMKALEYCMLLDLAMKVASIDFLVAGNHWKLIGVKHRLMRRLVIPKLREISANYIKEIIFKMNSGRFLLLKLTILS